MTNMNKFTQKSLSAVQRAQEIAREHGNQQIEQAHLLRALLDDAEGLIPQLLTAMGTPADSFRDAVQAEIDKLPKVYGGGREQGMVYISHDMDLAMDAAERSAAAMRDEFISVEHLFLGLLDHPDRTMKELFRVYNLHREAALKALASVRGNQRVTSDNPEETYAALKKYGSDLVERARNSQLDPVIGRDD
ncbi:MAG: type VI secretion system ATPase TssH, partial [Oscillibacter sp.]|nr:type VI secretion system ATPase TssH [Oscillibacter sp.]